jgi:hypothetical protein
MWIIRLALSPPYPFVVAALPRMRERESPHERHRKILRLTNSEDPFAQNNVTT